MKGVTSPDPPAPCGIFRRVAVSSRGPGQSPLLPSRAASDQCVLTAAAAGVPCGVLSALVGPSGWRTGRCAGSCGGRFTVFAAHHPPHPGRPPHASPRFRVREAPLRPPSAWCPGRPPSASPRCHVREAQILHLCAWCTWALHAPLWFLWVPRAPASPPPPLGPQKVMCGPATVAPAAPAPRPSLLSQFITCSSGQWPCLCSKQLGGGLGGAFLHSAGTARAQRGHSANYYGDYPGNNPENHPPAESCTVNSKLKNSNI